MWAVLCLMIDNPSSEFANTATTSSPAFTAVAESFSSPLILTATTSLLSL